MPYYDQQQPSGGGARDRITQALLAIQSPPPVTPMPPPPPIPMSAPGGMPGSTPDPGGMQRAGNGMPLGNSTIAAMTTPQLPGGVGAPITSTLGQQQQMAPTQPAPSMPSSPTPTQQY